MNFYEHLAEHPLKPQAKLAAAKFAPEHTDFRVESSISYLDSDDAVFNESSWAGPERSAGRKTYFRRDGRRSSPIRSSAPRTLSGGCWKCLMQPVG